MNKIKLASLLFIFSLLASCATIDKENINEVKTDKEQPAKSLVLAQSNTKYLKRKVAIGRFTNETAYGQSFFIDTNNNRIGKQAMDILSAKLFETERFIMIERADMAQIDKELSIGNKPQLSNSADFLILGSITEFGRKEVSDVGVFSRVKKQEAFARVHIRIVDVATGLIIYSEEGKGKAFSEAATTMGVGDQAGYDSSLNDKAITAAISDLSSNVVENMLGKPWRSFILGVEDNLLIVSGGKSQNIEPKSVFKVMKTGKEVVNPQTNMKIVLPGKQLATIEIVSSAGDTPETEVSFAVIKEGDLTPYITNGQFDDIYIEEIK